MVLPIAELEFLREVSNHRDLCRKLGRLGLSAAEAELQRQAFAVGVRWILLGQLHLKEARSAARGRSTRSAYSRAYYAAYNASKAVRYVATGAVSLKGDDHGKAPDLPGDFPDAARWSASITRLYEHRLKADYDNWIDPTSKFTLRVPIAVQEASEFVSACKRYLQDKHGIAI